jgi:hypothetical protein
MFPRQTQQIRYGPEGSLGGGNGMSAAGGMTPRMPHRGRLARRGGCAGAVAANPFVGTKPGGGDSAKSGSAADAESGSGDGNLTATAATESVRSDGAESDSGGRCGME